MYTTIARIHKQHVDQLLVNDKNISDWTSIPMLISLLWKEFVAHERTVTPQLITYTVFDCTSRAVAFRFDSKTISPSLTICSSLSFSNTCFNSPESDLPHKQIHQLHNAERTLFHRFCAAFRTGLDQNLSSIKLNLDLTSKQTRNTFCLSPRFNRILLLPATQPTSYA